MGLLVGLSHYERLSGVEGGQERGREGGKEKTLSAPHYSSFKLPQYLLHHSGILAGSVENAAHFGYAVGPTGTVCVY